MWKDFTAEFCVLLCIIRREFADFCVLCVLYGGNLQCFVYSVLYRVNLQSFVYSVYYTEGICRVLCTFSDERWRDFILCVR